MSHNSFPKDSWFVFQELWECWGLSAGGEECGKNHIDCLHHIMGRGNGDSKAESSIYNAAPMNNQACHLPRHGLLRTESHQRRLLARTYGYLQSIGRPMSDIDREFIKKYEHLYNDKG